MSSVEECFDCSKKLGARERYVVLAEASSGRTMRVCICGRCWARLRARGYTNTTRAGKSYCLKVLPGQAGLFTETAKDVMGGGGSDA